METGFFVVKPLTLIDSHPIFDRTHHIDLRLKNIRSDPDFRIFLLAGEHCTKGEHGTTGEVLRRRKQTLHGLP